MDQTNNFFSPFELEVPNDFVHRITVVPSYNEVEKETRFTIFEGSKELGDLGMVMQESLEPNWAWLKSGLDEGLAYQIGKLIDRKYGHGFEY